MDNAVLYSLTYGMYVVGAAQRSSDPKIIWLWHAVLYR